MEIDERRVIAEAALHAFGGTPEVIEYWDNDYKSSIDILICRDKPYKGVTSYSTIGLHERNIGYTTAGKNLRAEFVGAVASTINEFGNIIGSCAFNVINSKYSCKPGTIFPNVIGMYLPKYDMKHILLSNPFLWEDRLETIEFENKKVAWLLLVPISEKEYIYAQREGIETLEDLFETKQIDIFNLKRKSVVK